MRSSQGYQSSERNIPPQVRKRLLNSTATNPNPRRDYFEQIFHCRRLIHLEDDENLILIRF